MSKALNILLVGVGGQGTILASKILAEAGLLQGYDVKMTEIHGMAQRGGSVVTQVRMADQVSSPLIESGQADYLVAFEQLEALRWLHFLKPDGKAVVNSQKINPMTVITGAATYPEGVLEQILQAAPGSRVVDALHIARELGNMRVVNVVLLGALAKAMIIPMEHWQKALETTVPARFLDLNRRAFDLGYRS